MTTIKVTPEQLISISKKFKLAQQTATQMNSNLVQQISSMGQLWEGLTKEHFYYSFQISQKNMNDFVTLTDSIAKELRHHADKFRLADVEQGSMSLASAGLPPLATTLGMMATKGSEQGKPSYNFDKYDKNLVGNMWILSKDGKTDQEAAKATLAYNEALKNGDIKINNGSDDVDINLVQMEAFKEGYNPWTGEQLPRWHANLLVASSVFSSFAAIGRYGGGRVKINRGFKLKSGSYRFSKTDLIKAAEAAHPVKPSKLQVKVTEGTGDSKLSTNNLPKDPKELMSSGWRDATPEGMAKNTQSREYIDPETGLKVRFDPGKPGANGFEGKDHYHIHNPNSTGKNDYYLDVDGNPVPKGSKASHIVP
ncbi:WXG100 family type VII secretion target [Paenibacillus terrae]|uniref:WXG100 family type VII secretion target n=1 Tax=Paenibacillus terrae TaxID=159743 RepID=UPI000A4511E9|nr:WXG100 family type VII secretion target [Paenibacillus terrae]